MAGKSFTAEGTGIATDCKAAAFLERSSVRSVTRVLHALVFAAALALAPLANAQEGFPSKPIRVVVPYPAGGTADTLPRLLGPRLTALLGQPLVIENRPGASANLGAEIVAKADPDGYTLLVAAPHLFTTNAVLYKLAFDPAALTPVTIIAAYPNNLLAHPRVPFATVKDLIAYARAHPGQLNYASQGNSTSTHLTGELLKLMAGIDMVHVPYKGSAPALTDLIGGQVDVMFDNLIATMQYIKSGRLRVLGVGSPKRLPVLPSVPAIAETLPGFASETWMAIAAPPKTPPAIAEKLAAAVAEALKSPDIARQLADLNAEPVGGTPAQMAATIREDSARWIGVVRAAHVTVD